ncbi:MAG: hypothetical protein HFF50_02465 [Lawsonibacter sp.]|nr:hypothetical protein [Lawsonibacter sp.]
MSQKTHRICVKLRERTVSAAALKVLMTRNMDLMEKSWLWSLVCDLDRNGYPTQLYEEWNQDNGWKTIPITKDLLRNLLRSSQTTARQIAEERKKWNLKRTNDRQALAPERKT